MRSKKWMVLSLLVGTLLLMAVSGANILYTEAVLQKILIRQLDRSFHEKNTYPFIVQMQDSYNPDGRDEQRERILKVDAKAQDAAEVLQLPLRYHVTIRQANMQTFIPELKREQKKQGIELQLVAMKDLDQHMTLISGDSYAPLSDEGVLDVIAPEQTLIRHGLLFGETLTLDARSPVAKRLQSVPGIGKDGLKVRIVGVFKASDDSDAYWYRPPSYYGDALFVDPSFMTTWYHEADEPISSYQDLHYIMPDYTAMKIQSIDDVRAGIAELSEFMGNERMRFRDNIDEDLASYALRATQVRTTLSLLQIPIYLLLLAYIFMVSGQLIGMEQDEIAVFKSRGSSRTQILRIYLLQGVLIALIGGALAIPLAVFVVQVLGSSSAFMTFVGREALPTRFSWPFAIMLGATALLAVLVMVVPAFKVARVSIVEAKQRKRKRRTTPLWQRVFLDVILIAAALYARYSFGRQKDVLAQQISKGESPDALLFLASSLFVLGAALFVLRIIPWIAKAFQWLTHRFVGPAIYASFLQITRSHESRSFITVFLVLTVALGIFNASAARSVNRNGERDITYRNGADLVVKEQWESNAAAAAEDPEIELVYSEPDATIFDTVEGVEHYTRVYRSHDIQVRQDGVRLDDVELMGIHTKEFGQTAVDLKGLMPEHLNHYLNALAQDARAILVSENFKSILKLEVNDVFSYYTPDGEAVNGIIAGFVPYFPGYQPRSLAEGDDGKEIVKDNYLIVANLGEIQRTMGLRPYELWFKSRDQNRFIYDFAETTGRSFTSFQNTYADIIEMRNDPSFQGLNGILTVSFVVILVLAGTGFLIYWILSIQSRALVFGIQRAMGLGMWQVIAQLLNEQLFVTVPALLAGWGIGVLSSKLFVPLIQTAYAASDQTLPLVVDPATSDIVRLALIIAAVILLCMIILGIIVRRMKITQALKLGED